MNDRRETDACAEKVRCGWANGDPLYISYHDNEWGKPVHDDCVHFEFLVLESAQAGLSWITILRKRDAYRAAYDQFDPAVVAGYGDKKIDSLLLNTGIVRNKAKIHASIRNARRFLEVQREFGSFDAYLWSWVDGEPVNGGCTSIEQVPATSELSDRISKDLKARGFSFIGSTIIYSHLQAVGVVNDHITSCFRYGELTGV
ncbi:MAG: DNA-3-methyladenine glycosylase I [Spirochaetales bacterium]|nr:DNA-3-methyladenine glycosylase I [Spirochaetales bacterium]